MKIVKNDLKKKVDSLSRKIANPREYLDLVGQALLEEAHNRIQKKKKGPDGTPWAPWASSTAKARRRSGTASTGLLLNSGALDQSLGYKVSGPKVSVSTTSPYARYLQNGTSRMPARPFIGLGKVEERAIESIWKKWIKQD